MSSSPENVWVPTRAQLATAHDKVLPDVLAPDLKVVFCGINPGLYSAAVAHHFARPGNRFWPALFAGGFTPRVYSPFEDHDLLAIGYGLTNLVPRASAAADELSRDELLAGAAALTLKIERHQPRYLAVLGVGAYRAGFDRRKATLGLQDERIGGTRIWVLPNPSGLNAHYTGPALGEMFAALRRAADG
jgi:double-stranded uracil-DNA glycosylase